MFDLLAAWLNKGFVIGLISALLKGATELKNGKFLVTIFAADLVMSCLVGYSMWELMRPSSLSLWSKYLLTLLISLNGFVVVAILTNYKYIALLIRVLILRDRNSIDEFVNAYGRENGLKSTNKYGRGNYSRYDRSEAPVSGYEYEDEIYQGQPFEEDSK